jgi:hypothetical protein
MRIRALVWASLALLIFCAVSAPPARAESGVRGDLNSNGWVEWGDVPGFVQAWRAAKSGQTWPAEADVDGDGHVTHADGQALVEAILAGEQVPTGGGPTTEEVNQYTAAVAAVEAKWADLGGGADKAAQVMQWAIDQGLAATGVTTSDGESMSLTLPSGLSVAWLLPPGPTGTVTLPVQTQDVSDIAVAPGSGPGALVLSGGFNTWEDSGAFEAWRALFDHGYQPVLRRGPLSWTWQDLKAGCSGARVVYAATHGGWGKDELGVVRPFLLTPQPVDTARTPDPSTPIGRMWKEGSLIPGLYWDVDRNDWSPPYWGITDLFAQKYMKGLSDALVVINACRVGRWRWMAALSGNGAAAVAGYPEEVLDTGLGVGVLRARDVHSDVASILGCALFELQADERWWVSSSEIPNGVVPADQSRDDAFNLDDSLYIAAAWFPAAMPDTYQFALTDGTATAMAYSGSGTWGLIPHLDGAALSVETTTATFGGDFGDARGAIQVDDGAGKWATVLTPVGAQSRNQLAASWPGGAWLVRYRGLSGLLSNILGLTGGGGPAGGGGSPAEGAIGWWLESTGQWAGQSVALHVGPEAWDESAAWGCVADVLPDGRLVRGGLWAPICEGSVLSLDLGWSGEPHVEGEYQTSACVYVRAMTGRAAVRYWFLQKPSWVPVDGDGRGYTERDIRGVVGHCDLDIWRDLVAAAGSALAPAEAVGVDVEVMQYAYAPGAGGPVTIHVGDAWVGVPLK